MSGRKITTEEANREKFIRQLEAMLYYWKLSAGTWNDADIDPEIAKACYPFMESFDDMVPVVENWIETIKKEIKELDEYSDRI